MFLGSTLCNGLIDPLQKYQKVPTSRNFLKRVVIAKIILQTYAKPHSKLKSNE